MLCLQTATDHSRSLTDAGDVSCGDVAFSPVTALSNLLPSVSPNSLPGVSPKQTLIFIELVASVVTSLLQGPAHCSNPFD